MHELDIQLLADEMFDIFIHNSDQDAYLNIEGYTELTALFDEIPITDRGSVFVEFIERLDAAGVPYDKEQFVDDRALKDEVDYWADDDVGNE